MNAAVVEGNWTEYIHGWNLTLLYYGVLKPLVDSFPCIFILQRSKD